jgi:shikimate dehydrogenase
MILAAVLGSDVSQSRSPAIHHAAYQALGVEGRYDAFSVDAAGFAALVQDLGGRGYRYLNVTIPHKGAAAALATTRSAVVRNCAAANTLVFEPDRPEVIHADNTDGYGLLAALRDLGADVDGQDAVMVGAGGAAAGAVDALTAAGARVRVVARRLDAARTLIDNIPAHRRALATPLAWADGGLGRALDGAHMLISSVPAAAWTEASAAEDLAALARDTSVLEMAYGIVGGSPLCHAVRGHVGRYADGLGMLVHQAVRAIEISVGQSPPLGPLLAAARSAPMTPD